MGRRNSPTATSSSPPMRGARSSASFRLPSASSDSSYLDQAILAPSFALQATLNPPWCRVNLDRVSPRLLRTSPHGAGGLADLVGEAALVRAKPAARAALADQPPHGAPRRLRPLPGRRRGARGARRGPAGGRGGNPVRTRLL